MKRCLPAILAVGLCWSALSAAAADAGTDAETKIFLDSEVNATDVAHITVTEWYILPQALDRLPKFDPALESSPVSLKDAVALAQADLQKDLPKAATWSLKSVELQQIDRGNSGPTPPVDDWVTQETGKWYYKVNFKIRRPDPVTKTYDYPFPIYVLLDGSIAQRRVRSRTKAEIESEKQTEESFSQAVLKSANKKKH